MSKYNHFEDLNDLTPRSELNARRQEASQRKGRNKVIRGIAVTAVTGLVAFGALDKITEQEQNREQTTVEMSAPVVRGIEQNIAEHYAGEARVKALEQQHQDK
ncbi:MAG: hypothetical protein QFB86_03275 [Patescibacteria group bacterium]|nr:hypothetical protein [Patescibacteria group bacterium]